MDSSSFGYGSHSCSNPSSSHGKEGRLGEVQLGSLPNVVGRRNEKFWARRKQEEKAKEKLLIDATSIKKKETKQLAYAAKVDDDMISQKAENEMLKYKECIEELESKKSELRLEYESSKVAALGRGSINGSFGNQNPKVTKRLAVFRDRFRDSSARSERECGMCMAG